MEAPGLIDVLRELEVTLHQPAVRSDPARLGQLLHLSFREFGRSGTEYTREDVLREFADVSQVYQVWSQDFRVEELGPGVALLTYRSAHIDPAGILSRHTHRASLWQLGHWLENAFPSRHPDGGVREACELVASTHRRLALNGLAKANRSGPNDASHHCHRWWWISDGAWARSPRRVFRADYGRASPKGVLISTAAGDPEEMLQKFYKAFSELGCRPAR